MEVKDVVALLVHARTLGKVGVHTKPVKNSVTLMDN
jgi:hypothetical protein